MMTTGSDIRRERDREKERELLWVFREEKNSVKGMEFTKRVS